MTIGFAKYLTPWRLTQEREAERLAALRARDGDNCARCRRPIRFDVPDGHDHGATIERVAAGGAGIDSLRLCHARCFAPGMDHTAEVADRVRRKAEAALFAKPRRKRKAA
ncbi:MAG TPA: hypothetical protein VJM15_07945 [Sphingomicrobium sp.]|nr:hypothetical protein [Sphingomicrobium sp.]